MESKLQLYLKGKLGWARGAVGLGDKSSETNEKVQGEEGATQKRSRNCLSLEAILYVIEE
jgi:hypothetical protein